jgi:probable HAF family extracellular repeat protein
MKIFRPLPQLVLIAALAVPFAAHADPIYSITVVGTAGSGATDINNHGQVVGWLTFGASAEHAFIYSAGVRTDLGTLGGTSSRANALNDLGQVVGYADTSADGRRAFLFSSGVMTNLGALGGTYSAANGINNAGAVVGETRGVTYRERQGFLYSGGSMQSLAPYAPAGAIGTAFDINEAGQIVGAYTAGPETVPEWPLSGFELAGGAWSPMGHIGQAFDSFAYSINDHNQAVGQAHAHLSTSFAFEYSATGLHVLGSLSDFDTYAYDINNLGQSVGNRFFSFSDSHAMLYAGSGDWQDLNTLIDPSLGWTLTQASAINDLGQIAATGCLGGSCYALRLDQICAVPEPANVAMLLAGLGVFGWRSRRRGEPFQSQPIAPA